MVQKPRQRRAVAALVIAAVLLLPGCRAVSDAHELVDPSTVETIPGSDVARVTLTELAAQRLDIGTTTVAASADRLSVPSDALIIDPQGRFWVYTSPEPLVYLRHELVDVRQEGQTIFFAAGPEPGTTVVTVGVPELYGTESGIGH